MTLAFLAALFVAACGSHPLDRFEPDPRHPERDRSAMQDDGCLVKTDDTRVKVCEYGEPGGDKTVVLFGDSLAMAYFPAIEMLAKRQGWRLLTLTKMGCPPVLTPLYSHRRERTYHECATWRDAALREIEQIRPALIFVTGRMSTPATHEGEELGARRSRALLERGYVEVLERLRQTDARVVAFKDLPRSPRNGPDCVVAHPRDLDQCTFQITSQNAAGFDRVAAQSVAGVELLDLTTHICPAGVCRVAIDNKLVFRDFDHMTPTFARTLADPIDRALFEH
jgi:SGNH domain (fused to AT3 domains)